LTKLTLSYAFYVFDAYGTLFDVHSAVARHRAAVGPQADRLTDIWRTKQLEYTWVRSLMGAYVDFREVTAQALDFAAARCGGISGSTRAALLAAYETLDAYPDVLPALRALREQGAKTAILSNGTPAMLAAAVNASGLAPQLDACLSVDSLRIFKTAPQVYELVTRHFNCAPQDVSFQSSNRWDVAAAAKFGFRAVWINRTGQPDEYADFAPALVLRDLAALANESLS
jgi:2-haloacid dehalogenase